MRIGNIARMKTQPDTTRESLLQQINSIALMRRGTLSEQYFNRTSSDGRKVRLGPYFKFQIWQDGRNITRRVDAAEAATLREDIGNYHHFERLCRELAELNIRHTIDLRDEESKAATAAGAAEKKTSKATASRKNTARPKASSNKRGRSSRGGKARGT
jgi:hypothetical protein